MDLNAPLGTNQPKPTKYRLTVIAATVGAVAVIGAFGTFLALSDPHGGKPYVIADLPPIAPTPAAMVPAGVDTAPTGSIAKSEPPVAPSGPSIEEGVKVYRGGSQAASGDPQAMRPLVIDVTKALDGADKKRQKTAALVSSGSAASKATAPQSIRPRVAIFVEGMGVDEIATRTAIEIMPAGVTLAFVPYGDKTAAAVGTAKQRGHEILLQLPMQNAGGSAPGPHALRPGGRDTETSADMAWAMGRFVGYAGVTNLLGAPVTADTPVMTAVLKTIASRGLFYLDDGTSKASVVANLVPSLGVRSARADLVLDATSDPALVRANLNTLMAIAKRKGSAVGMASGLPEHLGAIARFAADLDRQGVTLVPVSAIVGAGSSIATVQ